MPEPSHIALPSILPDRWAVRLTTATIADEVVKAAGDYIAALDETEVIRIPAGCSPPPMRTPQDVCDYALLLTQAQLQFQGSLGVGLLLDRLAVFFSLASTRIAQLSFIERVRV